MACIRPWELLSVFLITVSFYVCFNEASQFQHLQVSQLPVIYEKFNLRRATVEINSTSSPGPVVNNASFTLAFERTRRRDPLNQFKHYLGGWNISENHYWASVGFTAVPLFVIAIVWFVGFGLVLSFICLRHFCCIQRSFSYSRLSYALSVILLTVFTCAAIIGCVVLYTGQGKFHRSTSETLDFIVNKANFTVENLQNFSESLSAAKKVGVAQTFLPVDMQSQIDQIEAKLNVSANDLSTTTENNADKIRKVLDIVRLILIIIAAVMLLLAFLGFLFSIFGLKFIVYSFVLMGWILVAGTFILCGVFLLLHNVTADTCIAMDGWLQNPLAHTALDDILPCVDTETAKESSKRSKEVASQLINIVNQVISNVSNANVSPSPIPFYYNQSGPMVPTLCNPYTSNSTSPTCALGEVTLENASKVWRNYVCEVSASEICTTVGRLTPSFYSQMTSAANVGYALYRYTPFLQDLQDCTFVRETFTSISRNNCPDLRLYSKWVYIGLIMVSGAVMLSLVFWLIYARERRHRKYHKQFITSDPAVENKHP